MANQSFYPVSSSSYNSTSIIPAFDSPSNSTLFSPLDGLPHRAQQPFTGPFVGPPRRPLQNQDYVSPYTPLSNDQKAESKHRDRPRVQNKSSTALSYEFPETVYRPRKMPEATLSEVQKQGLIAALSEHRVNTISELRRIERTFASMGSPDLTKPMTAAWSHFVNSHSLLNELRQLSTSFSSDCLDEAKRRVYQDPASNKSWNLCWLVLVKIKNDSLINEYARRQACRPEMWGGRTASAQSMDRLREMFVKDWTAALNHLLRLWDRPPIQ